MYGFSQLFEKAKNKRLLRLDQLKNAQKNDKNSNKNSKMIKSN